ncbi:MAG TPA: hypothetical protein DEP38_15345 [Cyanobacteria bacterium UBA9226]|nr:hypothetical protein [Cyanobacteria bacterium UBA9226]
MRRHPYEFIAKRALNFISKKSWGWDSRSLDILLSREDKQDCIGEATLAILLALKKKPDASEAYLFVVAKNRILQFLFGSHHKVKANNRGKLGEKSQSATIEGWKSNPPMIEKNPGIPWIEQNLGRVYQFLLSLKKQKSGRAIAALNRDIQILLLISWGWSYQEISEELNISIPNIRDYRKQLNQKLRSLQDGKTN